MYIYIYRLLRRCRILRKSSPPQRKHHRHIGNLCRTYQHTSERVWMIQNHPKPGLAPKLDEELWRSSRWLSGKFCGEAFPQVEAEICFVHDKKSVKKGEMRAASCFFPSSNICTMYTPYTYWEIQKKMLAVFSKLLRASPMAFPNKKPLWTVEKLATGSDPDLEKHLTTMMSSLGRLKITKQPGTWNASRGKLRWNTHGSVEKWNVSKISCLGN